MKIFITGINGFVGKILHKSLLDKGHDVFGTDFVGNNENIFSVDITQFKKIAECVKKVRPDIVYHLAAISKVDFHSSRKIYEINVNGTINLLNAISILSTIPKFILISSSQVYGIAERSNKPISEEYPINPVNHYGASKAAAENIAMAYHKEHDLPLTILRPFNHIGRGQDPHFVVPKILNAFRDGINEIDLGNINVLRDFLDVRDVVEIYSRFSTEFSNGEIFNIASGQGMLVADIIRLLEDITDSNLKINHEESLLRTNEITHIVGDASKLIKKYNWVPEYSVTDTLKWMLNE